ncbi:hypothetical protein BCS58_00830 [Enterovibrio norvegicus]|uniref:hypothetical protein n=1 Tax=Enterovibrio norvegicus TaxID=188144 RepID=UPI0038998EBB
MNKSNGVDLCEVALQRLLDGKPEMARNVGVEISEITPAMVSIEAGFDKGYLKRSRPLHKPLIARIDSLKKAEAQTDNSEKKRLRKALKECEQYKKEAEEAKATMSKVLTQNLILLQKVRELESELLINKQKV